MDKGLKHLTLNLVRSNASVLRLLEMGIEYAEIIALFVELEREGLIEKHGASYALTESGRNELMLLNRLLGYRGIEKFLAPSFGFQVPKMRGDLPYLPANLKEFMNLR